MSLRDILNQLPRFNRDAILIASVADGACASAEILWVNDALHELLGFTADAITGRGLDALFPPAALAMINRLDLQQTGSFRGDVLTHRADGGEIWVDLSVALAPGDDGESAFWIGWLRDSSGKIARERQLREALAETERLNQGLQAAKETAEAAERRLRAVIEALPDGFVLYDENDRLRLANRALIHCHPGAEEFLVEGARYEDKLRACLDRGVFVLDGEDPAAWLEQQLAERRRGALTSTTVQLSDGRWVQRSDRRLPTGEMVGLRVDVTEIKESEQALQRAQAEAELAKERLWNAIEAIPDAFVVFDAEDRLVICNEQYRKTYHWAQDLMVPGVTFEEIIRACVERGMQPEATGREEEWVAERMAEHRNPSGAIEQALPNERYLQISETRTSNGDTVGFRVDITELKRQQRRLEEYAAELSIAKNSMEHQALHDPLTELPNRLHLEQHLNRLTKRHSDPALQVAVLHVDLDRFKQINDTLGHAAGDFVLKEVAARLMATTREMDFVARIGGDEFVVVSLFWDDPIGPSTLAERLVTALGKPVMFGDRLCRFGASIGLAFAPLEGADFSTLIIDADVALYQAKREGRGQVQHFTPALKAEMQNIKTLSDELTHAMERDELEPFFHPQFDAQTLDLIGVESLVRWRHPVRGVLAPAAFLGTAEDMGILGDVDQLVFEKAVAACAALEARGLSIPKLSVNVSASRLNDVDFLLKRRDPGFSGVIALELLETIFFEDQSTAFFERLDALRQHGYEIELDDFGSGRASLLSLTQLDADTLKIDRGLITPIAQSPQHRRLVQAILEMARSFGVNAVAEGVETAAHVAVLRELGCPTLQGFAFARPMPMEELGQFMRQELWREAA